MSKKRNKIKLVQIIADSDLSGGPTHVLGILRNIDKRKFDVCLICPKGNLTQEAEKIDKVKVAKIQMNSKFDMVAKDSIAKALSEIQTSSNPFGPMIVHTHGPRAGFLGRMAIPSGAISVYTEHRWDADYNIGGINGWIQKKYLGKLNHKSDLVIAVSSSVKDFLIKNKLSPKDRTVVIPNGIETDKQKNLRTKEQRKISYSKHPIRIGSVGNLNLQKGYKYLISAMRKIVDKHPHITLEIIGDGPDKNKLLALIRGLKLEHHITLLGRKSDPESYMKNWDIFVLSSIAETFGIVLLEAMSLGVPIVATKVGGVLDVVEHNKSGILINPKDPKEISDAVDELIERPALAAQLTRGGQKRIEKFSWEKVVIELEREYERLTKKF